MQVVGRAIEQANRVIGPLDRFIGPVNGVLNKQVKIADFLFGRSMTVAELAEWVVRHFCSQCTFRGVFEAIRTYSELSATYKRVVQLASIDQNGCGTFQAVRNFFFDVRFYL